MQFQNVIAIFGLIILGIAFLNYILRKLFVSEILEKIEKTDFSIACINLKKVIFITDTSFEESLKRNIEDLQKQMEILEELITFMEKRKHKKLSELLMSKIEKNKCSLVYKRYEDVKKEYEIAMNLAKGYEIQLD